jgi:aldose 1-epimerase
VQKSLPEVVTLHCAPASGAGFLSAQLIPKRAMMLYQVRARLPEHGEFEVLASPPLAEGLARLSGGPGDIMGNASFSMGAAFLAPFVNRIRGRYDPVSQTIETPILGKRVTLPANGGGKAPNAEKYAIHGLILNRAVDELQVWETDGAACVRAILHAGDFGGQWLSSTDLEFEATLTSSALSVRVRATNAGSECLPIGLGWHPYFALPSKRREQARMHLPAKSRLPVNNYDEVLPTGDIISVAGTRYDFGAAGGVALKDLYLDDCFVDLEKTARGETVCEIIDPAAGYGLRLTSDSPQITALQTFAPPDKAFVVIEPQFSWADPYGREWDPGVDTGMVTLSPGGRVEYRARLEIFAPATNAFRD